MVDGGISGAYVTPLSLLDRRDGRIAKSHGRQQLSADHRHHLEPQRYAAAPHPSVQEARPTATPVGPWSSTCPTGLGTTSTHPPRGLRLPFRAHCRGHQGERSARATGRHTELSPPVRVQSPRLSARRLGAGRNAGGEGAHRVAVPAGRAVAPGGAGQDVRLFDAFIQACAVSRP